MTIEVRPAEETDLPGILAIHRAAFGSDVEAQLVADLLDSPEAAPVISVVAEDGVDLVAHVLLSSGHIPDRPDVRLQILAPLAVLPAHQNRGAGTAVTRFALSAAQTQGVHCVCVLGDPLYYGRFGFRSLMPGGPWPPFDLPAEYQGAWQSLALEPSTDLSSLRGERVRWAPPLRSPALWLP